MSVWEPLLESAIRAPSPHNVQPWRVRILSEQRADLLIEKPRTLPKEDPTGSFIILTMGLFIEALKILAANRSFRLDYELYQAPSQFTPEHIARAAGDLLPFARLELGRDDGGTLGNDYDNSLFLKRRTSRISLLPDQVPDEAVQSLQKLASEWGHRYEQVNSPETIERVLERNIDALFEDLNAPAYHDEIVEWFRFTDRSSRRTRDGLDYRCMNSSRLSFWLAARFPTLLHLPLIRPILRSTYRKQLGIVPTIGVLAGPFWKPESAFETGRFLMHFWLEVARRDLYIHPMGNLVTNQRAAEWCQKALGVTDIWLIFKIGFSKVPPQSYRRSVEEVLVA
jgi:nitroreductase